MTKQLKEVPVKKNETYTVEIVDLTHEGLGVAKIEQFPIFIENALPEEKVKIKIVKVLKKFAYGIALEIEEASPDRIGIKDNVYTRTGISPLQHLAYDKQLLFKQQQVENMLHKNAHLTDFPVEKTIGMSEPYAYRNKAQIPVRILNGQLTTGFFKKSSHELLPLEDFYIQDPAIDQAIIVVRDILRKYEIRPYNEEQHKGDLRHIVIRRGHYSHEMMVILVTRSRKLGHMQDIAAEIQAELPGVVSIIQNIHEEKSNVIMGKENIVLAGQDFITDQLLGLTFEISAPSFYQVNTVQAEILYQTAIDFAGLAGNETIIDAYCGIGTITLALAQHAKKVYGVEVVPQAVKNAQKNALLNNIDNVDFQIGKAEKVMMNWAEEGVNVDLLVVDPPRKGLAEEFVRATLEMAPEKIVYISCNPATMARDVALLAEKYCLKKVQPVDMFPQTTSVETVSLLVKK